MAEVTRAPGDCDRPAEAFLHSRPQLWSVGPELTLAERTYCCPACGIELDRDLNAAINLARYHPKDSKHASPLPAAA